jgi:alkanesulfonate monooxygenase SsuD/methylene tetrahydromethanopterin reductase-like flavin-dependent oxidoreductase (luciferase family)
MVKFGVHLGLSRSAGFKKLKQIVSYIDFTPIDSVFVADSLSSGYDTMGSLVYLSLATKRLNVGTCVFILPLRHPALVAKETSFIQRLSKNRLILGIGVGWRKKEFDLLGVNYNKRGKITDESIRFLLEAWSKDTFSFKGNYFRAQGVTLNSSLEKRPQIWVGGNSLNAMRRAARLGDRWIPTDFSVDDYLSKMQELRSILGRSKNLEVASHLFLVISRNRDDAILRAKVLAERFGDTLESFLSSALVGNPSDITKRISEYIDAGVKYHVLSLTYLQGEKIVNSLKLLEKEVIPSF